MYGEEEKEGGSEIKVLRVCKGRHEEVSRRMGRLEADQHGWGR